MLTAVVDIDGRQFIFTFWTTIIMIVLAVIGIVTAIVAHVKDERFTKALIGAIVDTIPYWLTLIGNVALVMGLSVTAGILAILAIAISLLRFRIRSSVTVSRLEVFDLVFVTFLGLSILITVPFVRLFEALK
jgi:hypothetical protein